MKKLVLHISTAVIAFTGCKPSYKMHIPAYKTVFAQNKNAIPDYESLDYWAAHPWKKDPSDSTPTVLQNEAVDTSVDVFFLHPTTFTNNELRNIEWNANINDPILNCKTDYTSILYQASVFNKTCRVFAPRYRQAHLYSFYTNDSVRAKAAFALAYSDIKKAFLYYLEHYNNGRPVIVASHSQGTVHATSLLKEFFENKPLQNQLICAYIVGMVLPKQYFTDLKPCTDSLTTGCFTGWRTYKKNYMPDYVKKENNNSWVINPLSWSVSDSSVSKLANQGAVLFNFKKILPHTNGATIHNGVLWIEKPRFPFSFLSSRKNYHPGDINLFYMNIRSNIESRKNTYFQHSKK